MGENARQKEYYLMTSSTFDLLEQALRLCIALSEFWFIRGYGQDGLRFLKQALAGSTSGGAAVRARALYALTTLGFAYLRNTELERLAEENLALCHQLGDPVGIIKCPYRLGGLARLRSRFTLAHTYLEEALSRCQEQGDRHLWAQCATELARVTTEEGQYERAQALLEKSLALYQMVGDAQAVGWVHYRMARLLFIRGQDLLKAQQLVEQSLGRFREINSTFYTSQPLGLLGHIHLEQGELDRAQILLSEGLAIGKKTGVETDTSQIRLGLARLAALQGDAAIASRLYRENLSLLLEYRVYQEGIAASLEGLAILEAGQGGPHRAARLWGQRSPARGHRCTHASGLPRWL